MQDEKRAACRLQTVLPLKIVPQTNTCRGSHNLWNEKNPQKKHAFYRGPAQQNKTTSTTDRKKSNEIITKITKKKSVATPHPAPAYNKKTKTKKQPTTIITEHSRSSPISLLQ